jgi:SsrA-binding protein
MSAKQKPTDDRTIVTTNRKARHDFFIEETFEAGISLVGTEVKSIRDGRINLKDSYALINDGEAFLIGCHISPYSHGNIMNHEPERTRKLLLHKRQILMLTGKLMKQGYTVVPLSVYINKAGKIKLELGLAKGKKFADVRETLKEKEAQRDIDRALRDRNK